MSRGLQSSRVHIEEILKKNDHVWNAYTSGKFSVKDYYENAVRKIVLKERTDSESGKPTGYNITKYRVRIRRGHDEDHILLVQFADNTAQNGATLTREAVPALPPAVITRQNSRAQEATSSSPVNSQSYSGVEPESSPSQQHHYEQIQQQEYETTSPRPSTSQTAAAANTSLNALAEDFYAKLTGPGSDLIERLVDGHYVRSQSSATLKEAHVSAHESEHEVNETAEEERGDYSQEEYVPQAVTSQVDSAQGRLG